jgi:vacuolar-type H+-ATPase subunit I/STV1
LSVVVDANALVVLAVDRRRAPAVESLLREWREAGETLHAPTLLSTVLGGFIMFVYSCLLVVTNRRSLPAELKLRGYRLGIIAFAILLLGTTSVIVGRPVRKPVLMRRLFARVLAGLCAWGALVAIVYATGLA